MKYVLFSLSDEIILPETKRDGTKKWPHTPMKMKFRNGGQTPDPELLLLSL
jgi:hypothetical protein